MRAHARRLASVPAVNPSTWWDRIRRVNPLIWDSLLAAFLARLVAATVAWQQGVRGPASWALVFAASAPLALRRRAPLAVLAVVAGVVVLFAIGGHSDAAGGALATGF